MSRLMSDPEKRQKTLMPSGAEEHLREKPARRPPLPD